jgi:hypothetical protein
MDEEACQFFSKLIFGTVLGMVFGGRVLCGFYFRTISA